MFPQAVIASRRISSAFTGSTRHVLPTAVKPVLQPIAPMPFSPPYPVPEAAVLYCPAITLHFMLFCPFLEFDNCAQFFLINYSYHFIPETVLFGLYRLIDALMTGWIFIHPKVGKMVFQLSVNISIASKMRWIKVICFTHSVRSPAEHIKYAIIGN